GAAPVGGAGRGRLSLATLPLRRRGRLWVLLRSRPRHRQHQEDVRARRLDRGGAVKARHWKLVSCGAALALALAVLALGCGPDTVTLPTPPMEAQTAALVMTYQMPTA